jgi:hypothetical protein
MKTLTAIALMALVGTANAQVVCNTYGNQTTCGGFNQPGLNTTYVNPMAGYWQQQQQISAQQAAAWQAAVLRDQCLKDARVTDKSACYRIGQ